MPHATAAEELQGCLHHPVTPAARVALSYDKCIWVPEVVAGLRAKMADPACCTMAMISKALQDEDLSRIPIMLLRAILKHRPSTCRHIVSSPLAHVI